MTVVADTSPLNYLILIGAVEVLPQLYGEILLAPACAAELLASAAPELVQKWMKNPPAWIKTIAPTSAADVRLGDLDSGEREAIALAIEVGADLVLIDERDERSVAEACGLKAAGMLRVIDDAAAMGLLDLPAAIAKLRSTSFRVKPHLLDQLQVGSRVL